MMTFNQPWYLIPVACVVIMGSALLHVWVKKRHITISRLAHKTHQSLLIRGYSFTFDILHAILRIIALACIGIALLDPRGAPQTIESAQYCKDVMFVVDISRSMLAEDVQPSRLEAVKKIIRSFVNTNPTFACGLTIFSSSALTLCPITHEKSTFFMFLDDLNQKTVTAGGTSMKAALEYVASYYEKDSSNGSHICVVFTDGEDFSGDLSEVTQKILAQNITLCFVGVGSSAGAPIPFYNERGVRQGHIKDAQGAVVISQKNEQTLIDLAKGMKGKYLSLDKDYSELVQWLNHATQQRETSSKTVHYDSYAYYASFLAWLILIFDWILP